MKKFSLSIFIQLPQRAAAKRLYGPTSKKMGLFGDRKMAVLLRQKSNGRLILSIIDREILILTQAYLYSSKTNRAIIRQPIAKFHVGGMQ